MIKKLAPGFLLVLNGEAHHSLKVLLNPAFNTHAVNGEKQVCPLSGQDLSVIATAHTFHVPHGNSKVTRFCGIAPVVN